MRENIKMSRFIKTAYSVIAGLLVISGISNDIFTAAAVICLYAGLVFLPEDRLKGVNVPILCIVAVDLCYIIAAIISCSDAHDTCMQCVRLSAFMLPFLLKRDFIERQIIPAVYCAIIVLSIAGLAAYILKLPVSGAVLYDTAARLQSFTGYANVTCVLCLTGVYLAADYYKRQPGAVHIIIGIINLAAAVLTFSRLGFACFAVSALIYTGIKYRRSRVYIGSFLGMAAVAAAVIIFSGQYRNILSTSMVNRIVAWTDAVNVILKQPYGIGAGSWRSMQYSIQSADYSIIQIHNSLLQIALDGGIAAAAAFTVIPVYAAANCRERNIYIPVTVFIMLHAITDMDFYFTGMMFTTGVFLRMCAEPRSLGRKTALIYCAAPIIFGAAAIALRPAAVNPVDDIAEKYRNAYAEGDLSKMYEFSSEWISAAPKQENAYTAYIKTVKEICASNEYYDRILRINIDGRDCTADITPVRFGENVYLPLRETAEMNGYSVIWDNRKQEMLLRKDTSGIRIRTKNVISNDGEGLRHKAEDIFVIGSRIMINVDKLTDIFDIKADTDADIIYIHKLQNGE